MNPKREKKGIKQPPRRISKELQEEILERAKEYLIPQFVEKYYERWLTTPEGQKLLQEACAAVWAMRTVEERVNRDHPQVEGQSPWGTPGGLESGPGLPGKRGQRGGQ